MFKKVKTILALAVGLMFTAQPAFAALNAAGQTNAQNGFPTYYQDSNGVALEIGLDPLYDFFDPPIAGNNFSQQIGFGGEAFWFLSSAIVDMPVSPALPVGGKALIVMGVEAAFATGNPVNGQQFPFNRLRIRIDAPLAGSYIVTHPYGVDVFTVDVPGINAVNSTIDIGGVMPDALTALSGRIGPFLTAVNPAPPLGHIGNGNILQTVTGSPFGTNYFRIQGPGGIDIQTDQFNLQGKLFTGVVNTPVSVERVTYTRTTHTGIDVMAISAPTAHLSVVGLTPLPATMVGDGTGKFYRHIHLNGAGLLPAAITVTAVNPPNAETSLIKNLVDVVQITRADYDVGLRTLTIEAASGDTIAPPVLTATGFGNLTAGSLVVSGILVPPASVTVTSSIGGSDTRTVSIGGHDVLPNSAPAAADDTANTILGTAVNINVLANDVDTDGIINPATLTITTAPLAASGTAVKNADNTINFTPATGFSGAATFNYTVQDDLGALSNIATVSVNVVAAAPAPNIAPVANNDTATTNLGAGLAINLTANDTDADGTVNPATVAVVISPVNGALVNNLDGTVSYTPNAGFSGADSFTYNVRDNLGALSNTATVSITVNPAETLTIASARFRQVGARWQVSGTDSIASPVILIRVFLERTGEQIGSANVAVNPLLPNVWSVSVRNSTIVPQAGDRVRVESSNGAVASLAVTITR